MLQTIVRSQYVVVHLAEATTTLSGVHFGEPVQLNKHFGEPVQLNKHFGEPVQLNKNGFS